MALTNAPRDRYERKLGVRAWYLDDLRELEAALLEHPGAAAVEMGVGEHKQAEQVDDLRRASWWARRTVVLRVRQDYSVSGVGSVRSVRLAEASAVAEVFRPGGVTQDDRAWADGIADRFSATTWRVLVPGPRLTLCAVLGLLVLPAWRLVSANRSPHLLQIEAGILLGFLLFGVFFGLLSGRAVVVPRDVDDVMVTRRTVVVSAFVALFSTTAGVIGTKLLS